MKMVMKIFLLAAVGLLLVVGGADAGGLDALMAGAGGRAADQRPVISVDWQDPALLPPPFRNHCGFVRWSGRPYCADHCGSGYEFYFCTPDSFGCCRVGHGYCDYRGHLRCHP
jgi:hypothetical protein